MHQSNFFATLALLLTPAFTVAAPVDYTEPPAEKTCTEKSMAVTEWAVIDFDYHADYIFSTPAHQNSWGYVAFNLTNPAVDYVVSCAAASNRLSTFFYGDMAYTCTVPEGASTKTTFTFNQPTGELAITQKWTCFDDPQYPTTFTAVGNETLSLTCSEESWQNPNWEIGQIYSSRNVKCDKITVHVPVKQLSAVA